MRHVSQPVVQTGMMVVAISSSNATTGDAKNSGILSVWRYNFTGVSKVNAIIYQVEQSGLTTEDKQKVEAELRGLRAYYYYNLLDCFGNVPVVTDFTQKELPTNTPRKDVFAFIEKELKEILPLLPSGITYGRFTQNVANTLLARLYLNAEVFTGTARWQDCLDACNKVQGYSLTPIIRQVSLFRTKSRLKSSSLYRMIISREQWVTTLQV